MPKLNPTGKISKEKTDKVAYCLSIVLAIIIGVYFMLFLGAFGLWSSAGAWIGGFSLTVIFCLASYRSISKVAFKRLLAFILLCILFTTPVFGVTEVVKDQSAAQNLSNLKEINYFKTLLGKGYNYTELIVWENQHLNFSYGNIQRNTDPIKIYQYGEGRCQEFAILYAELCISQGYRCRIVDNIFNDHMFNEVFLTNGTWIRVDASLNSTSARAIGYPMFFEQQPGWGAPILSLAFENSSIVDVTSTYRSDGFDIFSPIVIILLFAVFTLCNIAITRFLILVSNTTNPEEEVANLGNIQRWER